MNNGLRLDEVELEQDYQLSPYASPTGFTIPFDGGDDPERRKVTAIGIENRETLRRLPSKGRPRYMRMVVVRRPNGEKGWVKASDLVRTWESALRYQSASKQADGLADVFSARFGRHAAYSNVRENSAGDFEASVRIAVSLEQATEILVALATLDTNREREAAEDAGNPELY